MVKTPPGYLRRPAVAGFMAPGVVNDLAAAVQQGLGSHAHDAILADAQLHRLPGAEEPVREDKALRLHHAVKRLFPAQSPVLMAMAGGATAERLLDSQQSARAQAMLAGSPWPIAAWLLGRWATLHAWTFAGSARFTVVNALEYTLTDNPLHRGESATHATSDWHRAFFERLFRRVIDTDLECREVECAATGAAQCRFLIARP
jgi:divinyl protochlorophyllide a 8-vinyl-reductase